MSQTLKFRLQDGHIYDFEYSKYSDFIDNLEPEPGVIIDVLEPFTLEDFETAQIEYNKYVFFKESLEDIITMRKLWSKEELKELSKYDLNNLVLEWLMIRETREDKEIKEKLSLDSFHIREIKSDNIILYYIVDETNQIKFKWACYNGHLKSAQWLYSIGYVNIHSGAFFWACIFGHLKVAQWLWSLGGFHKKNINSTHQPIIDWLATLE